MLAPQLEARARWTWASRYARCPRAWPWALQPWALQPWAVPPWQVYTLLQTLADYQPELQAEIVPSLALARAEYEAWGEEPACEPGARGGLAPWSETCCFFHEHCKHVEVAGGCRA